MDLNKKNKLFSKITGEEFTNKEVIIAHIGLIALLAMCFFADYVNSSI